ncbi:hypothetical protein DM806_12080 [Sphingobium lactosutens]|nr:hypothetical protein [Sphingobium lactosutens]
MNGRNGAGAVMHVMNLDMIFEASNWRIQSVYWLALLYSGMQKFSQTAQVPRRPGLKARPFL